MELIRFRVDGGEPRVGLRDGATVTGFAALPSVGDLLALPLDQFRAACADPGGAVVPAAAAELLAPYALTIELAITRDGAVAWQGSASTAALHRRIDELAAWLFRADDFPAGVILSTGTSLVPELPFTLQAGDEVRIRIPGIGELVNPVVRGKAAVAGYTIRP